MTMQFWSFYFLAKLVLLALGKIEFHWWLNVLLLAVVIWPLPRISRTLRALICVPLGLLLLYHDSHMPPVRRAIEAWAELSQFSWQYQLELLGRLFEFKDLLILVIATVLYWLLSMKLRMASFAVLGVLAVPLVGYVQNLAPSGHAEEGLPQQALATSRLSPQAQLAQYYEEEQARRTIFPGVLPQPPEFDVFILNVCSLSWDDLELVGALNHPVLQQFDVVFTRFNSAASYSGPAAIRLMRSSCGAGSHQDLYEPIADSCLLIPHMQRLGYSSVVMLNHDGGFGNYLQNLREFGRNSSPLLQVQASSQPVLAQFDGSPLLRDRSVFTQWLQSRAGSHAPQVSFYNTSTLHDGNRLFSHPKLSSDETFPLRLDMFLGDLKSFMADLEKAGRPTIVFLVPEHGAAMRGDDWQISGLREVPTPSITNVPFAVRLIGRELRRPTIQINDPVSYLAVSELLSRFLLNDPFGPAALELEDYLQDLPQSRFVAENESIVVMDDGEGFIMRDADGRWRALDVGVSARPLATGGG